MRIADTCLVYVSYTSINSYLGRNMTHERVYTARFSCGKAPDLGLRQTRILALVIVQSSSTLFGNALELDHAARHVSDTHCCAHFAKLTRQASNLEESHLRSRCHKISKTVQVKAPVNRSRRTASHSHILCMHVSAVSSQRNNAHTAK